MHSVIAAIPEEELLALAGRFTEAGVGGNERQRVHVRGGHLAATDGRILLHVESPAVRDTEGAVSSVVGFRPEYPATRVAGADWVMGELAPAIAEKHAQAEKRARAAHEEAEREARRKAKTCPHCYGEVVVDENGDLVDFDEYLAELQAAAAEGPSVWLHFGGARLARKVRLHYLATALDAARRLGGDAELWIGEGIQVILWGAGFFVVIATMRRDGRDVEDDIDVQVPAADDGRAAP